MADEKAQETKQAACAYCGAAKLEEQDGLLYECGSCGTLYCDTCSEGKGCPNCGAPLSQAHPIEPMGMSSWNPNQGG